MGVNHSIADEAASHKDETCFGAIPAFPDLMSGKLAALVPLGHRSRCASPPTADFETPRRKLSDPTEVRASTSLHLQLSSEGSTIHRELASINREQISTMIPDDEFILLDPKRLAEKSCHVMCENNRSVLSPHLQPRSSVPALILPDGDDLSTIPMLDLERFLREGSQGGRDKFIPIRETDEEDSIQEEASGMLQPTLDPSIARDVPTFKLKPRKGRNPWDYKLSL